VTAPGSTVTNGVRLPNATGTAVTTDNSLAVYSEHVAAVTDNGCEVLDLSTGEGATFYDRRISQ
jgi:methionyl aminopeptidase